jgi:hypothetical protein
MCIVAELHGPHGVNAGSRKDSSVTGCHRHDIIPALRTYPGDNETGNSGSFGACQYFRQTTDQRGIIKMAVGIYKHVLVKNGKCR